MSFHIRSLATDQSASEQNNEAIHSVFAASFT